MTRAKRLETADLVLRKARSDDTETIFQNVWSDRETAQMMLWKPTESLKEAEERMERTLRYQSERDAWFVCLKETDMPIGFAGIREEEPGVYEESGICVCRGFQHKGYGKQIVRALCDYVFNELRGKKMLYGCFRENRASAALCRSQGFEYIESKPLKREWDGYETICDYYQLTNEKYISLHEQI